jgi:hypothetical protein
MTLTGIRTALKFLCIIILVVNCKNPFFPRTGLPNDSSRSTPENVIRQLKKAYENRRIDLFEDLLYSIEDFRFYIEQTIALDSLKNINRDQSEKIVIDKDLNEDFIAYDELYVYLTYSEEMNIHRNLFREAEQITFSSFEPYTVEYFPTQIIKGDSVVSDTLEAVAYTDETEITISSLKLAEIYGEKTHLFPVGKQVFFMKKDPDGLWKIIYWFERHRSFM